MGSLLIFIVLIIFIGIIWSIFLMPVRILGWTMLTSILAFPLYNMWILSRCSGDCGIRLDLILVIPLVVIMLITWSVKYLMGRKNDSTKQVPGGGNGV